MDGHEARASMLRPGRPTAATIIQARWAQACRPPLRTSLAVPARFYALLTAL